MIFAYLFFALYKREFTYDELSNVAMSRKEQKLIQAKGLDYTRMTQLRREKEALEEEITALDLLALE